MKARLLTCIRLTELICGFAVFLLGLWMWWHMFLMDHSNGKKFESNDVWLILLIVAPGMLVACGSLLQAAYRKVWPVALVLVGSAVALWSIGVVAQFIFGWVGDRFALHLVYADLVLLSIAVGASLVNAAFSNTGVEKRR